MSWIKELFDSLAESHPELNNSGFAHVANVGELQLETSYELADGLLIRKARPNEVSTLKNLFLVTRPFTPLVPTRNPYETAAHSEETKPGTMSFSTRDLPVQEWRYHVIVFQGTNVKLHNFIDATVLTRSRLELGPTVFAIPGSSGPSFGGGSALERLWEELRNTDELFLSLGPAELDDLRLVYEKVSTFQNDRVDLQGAMNRIKQLDTIPKSSPFRFLGYISVLESLITHAPDPKDPYDSLTRQVRQKMLLVGRRSLIPIPYGVFGDDVKPESLWTCLYKYRGAIAHGTTPDFDRRLQCLKNPAKALEFISCATVAVMRQALEEPDLIADLHAC